MHAAQRMRRFGTLWDNTLGQICDNFGATLGQRNQIGTSYNVFTGTESLVPKHESLVPKHENLLQMDFMAYMLLVRVVFTQ